MAHLAPHTIFHEHHQMLIPWKRHLAETPVNQTTVEHGIRARQLHSPRGRIIRHYSKNKRRCISLIRRRCLMTRGTVELTPKQHPAMAETLWISQTY